MDFFLQAELHRLNIRKKAFCRPYRISLRNLQPEDESSISCQLDTKNVARLIKIFELEGCLRLEPTHYIPALTSRQHFASIPSNITAEPPTHLPHEPLIYFQGRYRIEAAWKFFHSSEWWWVVDLFFEDQYMLSLLNSNFY